MDAERWMARCFAAGSTCFVVGPFPGWLQLVGERATALAFFVGSLFFTAGGALYVVPSSASVVDLAAANWTTSLGAACFLACAVGTLHERRAGASPESGDARRLAARRS